MYLQVQKMGIYRIDFSFTLGILFKLILKFFDGSFLAVVMRPDLTGIDGRILFDFDIRIQLIVKSIRFLCLC